MKFKKEIVISIYILLIIILIIEALKGNPKTIEVSNILNIKEKLLIRKAFGHYGVYVLLGIFGLLTFYLLSNKIIKSCIISINIGIMLSFITEMLQFIPEGRHPTINDFYLNISGNTTGTLLMILYLKFKYYLIWNKNNSRIKT